MIIRSYCIISLSIITVNNKENKDEEFLSFLQISTGLFLSDVSVLTQTLEDFKMLLIYRTCSFPNSGTMSFIRFTLLPSVSF